MAQGLPPLSHQADGNVTSGTDGEIFLGRTVRRRPTVKHFSPSSLKEEAETETIFTYSCDPNSQSTDAQPFKTQPGRPWRCR